MADTPSHPADDRRDDTDDGVPPDTALSGETPRWVKVFGAVAVLVIVLLIVLLLFGGGDHGPGRHTPSGAPGSGTPLASFEHGGQRR